MTLHRISIHINTGVTSREYIDIDISVDTRNERRNGNRPRQYNVSVSQSTEPTYDIPPKIDPQTSGPSIGTTMGRKKKSVNERA